MSKPTYQKHLSDQLRIQIVENYIKHELRKLFPSIRKKDLWKIIDGDVSKWFNSNPTLAPIRDFWNGAHAISTGFKLKQIVPWVTSKNIKWSKKELDITKLNFGTNFTELEQFNYRPSVKEVQSWYLDPKHKKEYTKALSAHKKRSNETSERDSDPIIVVTRDSKSVVVDGNRRLLKAILEKKNKITAVVGKISKQPELFENWVSTPLIQDLVRVHRKSGNTKEITTILSSLLKDSSAGRYEFKTRSINLNEKADLKLYEAVNKKLKL